jgi:uncharacterized YigZ family protein
VSGYPIPARRTRVHETIRRSRFITTLAHAPTAEAAHEFVALIRDEFADATHNCWAFVAGPPGSTAQVGMSDDGEPHGTAGRPMLTTLLHSGVGEVVAVCTRYYGGVKLGTGGLARAYSSGVKVALEDLRTIERVDRVRVAVTLPYPAVDVFLRLVEDLGVVVTQEDYAQAVTIECEVPDQSFDRFELTVSELTKGGGSVVRL